MTEAIYDELAAEGAPAVPESEADVNEGEAVAEDGEKSTGRPRPSETIERDAKVLEYMNSVDQRLTKVELVEGTGLPGNEVYLSLYRLGKGLEKRNETPRVERLGRQWGVVGKEYPVVETPAEAEPVAE